MSTRANIIVYIKDADKTTKICNLYRHSDGYPTGLWQELLNATIDCSGDRELLACLWSMKYPPSFATDLSCDIEYLYKIYAGEMEHLHDKKYIKITVQPVKLRDATPKEFEAISQPNTKDEMAVNDFIIKELKTQGADQRIPF